jgi:hypothetical protein
MIKNQLRLASLALSLLAISCNFTEEKQPETASLQQALTTSEQRVLNFELVSDWKVWSGTGTLSAGSPHSEGAKSLAVSGMGYAGVRNVVPLTNDQYNAPEVVGYDVWIPTQQVNPNWSGDTQLVIDAPSAGIYQQYLGYRSFAGLPRGQFTRIEFALPDWIRQALDNSNYTDLRFVVAINVAPGSATHYLDRFILGPEPGTNECTPVNDQNPCTADACDPATGQTTHIPLAPGALCSDGNACDGVESCDGAGACAEGVAPVIDDGSPCTSDACHPSTGVSHTPVSAGVACGDANACNGIELCDGTGACRPGASPVVDDANPCTADACVAQGGVTHTPVSAGVSCGDANACNGAETCNGAGTCQAGTPIETDNGNTCTIGSCNPETGAVTQAPAPVDSPCGDGDLCNGSEFCDGAGTCAAGTPLVFDDGNACTVDSCDSVFGVENSPESGGASCADGDVCNGAEACDGAGSCLAGTSLVVDDGNTCTIDSCDPTLGAQHDARAAGSSCDDGSLCNGSESCDGAGSCQASTAVDVDDDNACTVDSCDPAVGVSHAPATEGTSCEDGDLCNGNETCNTAGNCVSRTAVSVDDNNPCTADSCDPEIGVQNQPVATGTACGEGNLCNGEEACDPRGACVSSDPPIIDDGNPCTADACTPEQGVTHVAVPGGRACDDGDVCNGTETCDSSGSCLAGTPVSATVEDNACITGANCDPTTGLEYEFETEGTACADGFICDGAGSCLRDQGGGTLPVPPPPGSTNGINVYGPQLPRTALDGCALESISPNLVAVITGIVGTANPIDGSFVPLPDAVVTIPKSCQFGTVRTQFDGTFRLPVNGGARHVVRVEADADGDGTFDYLPLERPVETRWRGTVGIDTVVMVLPSETAETLVLETGVIVDEVTVAGPLSLDDRNLDGVPEARTPTLLFKAGTVVAAVDPAGNPVELDAAAIRMTEYTVGPTGLQQMPAPPPPGTVYSYAVELSIDGAEEVYFDRPVAFYLENFIAPGTAPSEDGSNLYQVGQPMPSWFYDRDEGAWRREEDGIILQIVALDDSSPTQVLLDVDDDGDADADDESYLTSRQITIDADERAQLAEEVLAGRRALGDELWRIELTHFSTYDFNPILHCGDACLVGNILSDATLGGISGGACTKQGCIVQPETRSLRESLPIAGTPFSLNYSSSAVIGYRIRSSVKVDRSVPPLPRPFLHISGCSSFNIAGRPGLPGCLEDDPDPSGSNPSSWGPLRWNGYRSNRLIWNGRDANGDIAVGTHKGELTIMSGIGVPDPRGLNVGYPNYIVRYFSKSLPFTMSVYDAKVLGLGGWSLSPHHFYDAEGGTIFQGDGTEWSSRSDSIRHLHNLPFNVTLDVPGNFHVLADGSMRLSNNGGVYGMDTSGQVERWEGGTVPQPRAIVPDGPKTLFVGDSDFVVR